MTESFPGAIRGNPRHEHRPVHRQRPAPYSPAVIPALERGPESGSHGARPVVVVPRGRPARPRAARRRRVGLGFLLVDVVLPFHGIGGQDERSTHWLAAHRDSALDDASYVGSSIGDIPFVPGLVILGARRGGPAPVARLRPDRRRDPRRGRDVPRRRAWSCTASARRSRVSTPTICPSTRAIPSGHVAASVVVYVGLALVLSASCARAGGIAIAALDARHRAAARRRALANVPRHAPSRSTSRPGASWVAAAIAIALVATRAAGEGRTGAARDARRSHRTSRQVRRWRSAGASPSRSQQRGVTDVFWREVGEEPLRSR